jgi:hypothetical protein
MPGIRPVYLLQGGDQLNINISGALVVRRCVLSLDAV